MKIREETAKLFAIKHMQETCSIGRYEFYSIHFDRIHNQWVAMFDYYTSEGYLLDGPVACLVDGNTGFVEVEVGP